MTKDSRRLRETHALGVSRKPGELHAVADAKWFRGLSARARCGVVLRTPAPGMSLGLVTCKRCRAILRREGAL